MTETETTRAAAAPSPIPDLTPARGFIEAARCLGDAEMLARVNPTAADAMLNVAEGWRALARDMVRPT